MSLYNDASLVMIPSAVKDGKLYSIRPTDGSGDFTFSRGSNLAATRVDVNGLIEKGRENLITYSNDFTQWNQQNVNVTTNAVQNPFNTGTTQTITEQVSTTQYRVYTNSYTTSSGIVYAHSAYVKRLTGTRDFAIIDVNGGARVYFDMTNISVGTELIGKGKIEDVGNGWYRLSVYGVATGNSSFYLALTNGTSGGSETYTSDGSGSYALYGAQLEVGLVATDYIETTTTTAVSGITEDLPRLDYSGGASCPSLLLEPTRTNLLPHSEFMTASNWQGGQTTASVVLSSNLSPEGKANCYQVTRSSSSTSQVGIFTTITNGSTYTGSIYIKSISGSLSVELKDVNGVSTTKSITTDWTRIDVTTTATSTTGRLYLGLLADGDVVEIYGAQLEEASYPSSYIPTYGSAVTRSFDDSDVFDTNSFGTDGEDVTYFFEFVNNTLIARDSSATSIRVNNAAINFGSFRIYRSSSSASRLAVVFQDTDGNFTPSSTQTSTDNVKVLIKRVWDTGLIELFINGVKEISATSTLFNAWTKIEMEGTGSTINVKQVLIFPTALTDSECIALTTL